MQKFKGVLLREVDSSLDRNVYGRALITVKSQSTGELSTIYSDDGVTLADNPFYSDSLGEYSFFAANGEYKIEIGAPVFKTEENITLFDPDDFSAFPEAPDNGATYGRNGFIEGWEQVTEEAPFSGTSYLRRNGNWVIANTVEGGSFPAKAGDNYESNSGPLDPNRDIELNGQSVSGLDYPDLIGLPGYTVQNDPTGVTGLNSANLVTFSNSASYTGSFINKQKTFTLYASMLTSYAIGLSSTNDENIDFTGSVFQDFRWAKFCGDTNFLVTADSSSGVDNVCNVFGIYDPIINIITVLGPDAYTRLAMAASEDGNTIVVGTPSTLEHIQYSTDGGNSFSVVNGISATYNYCVQVEQLNDEFYLFFGDIGNSGSRIRIYEIYKTSDFVNFENLTSFMPASNIAQVDTNGGSIFYVTSGTTSFVTSDFENYAQTTLFLRGSVPLSIPIIGSNGIIANSSEQITFDNGATIEVFGGGASFIGGYNAGHFNGTHIYIPAAGSSVYKYEAVISAGGIITVPNATSNVSGAKFYARATNIIQNI